MRTIVQLTIEVEHDDASHPADVASRVARVACASINDLDFQDELLHDVKMYRTRLLSTNVNPQQEKL